jgi:hypothetical protein
MLDRTVAADEAVVDETRVFSFHKEPHALHFHTCSYDAAVVRFQITTLMGDAPSSIVSGMSRFKNVVLWRSS